MPGRRQHGEGSVFKRNRDGRWVARADLGFKAGRRDVRLFVRATPEGAIDARADFLARRRDGFTPPKGRQPYVSEWMLHWLHNIAKRKVRESTWDRSYRQKVEELIVPYFERVPLPDLTEEHVEEWHAHLEGLVSARTHKPLSGATIAQAHRIMSTGLKAAVVRGKMPRNPCSNVTPPASDAAEPEPPSRAEAARILARCETWPNGPRWVLAIATGLRQGEALALQWADVELRGPAPTVSVRKGKTVNARRTIGLPAVAVTALARHRRETVASIDGSGLVFARADGRPVDSKADWSDWQALLADLGLRRYRVHDLRHATATFLLEAGEDIRVVQAIMGHATPDFTRRAYQHVRPAMKRRAAESLDDYLRGDG